LTGLSLLNLVPAPGRIVAGRVVFEGRDLLALPERELLPVRGGGIGLVFQEPGAALDPVRTIGSELVAGLRRPRGLDPQTARGGPESGAEGSGRVAAPGRAAGSRAALRRPPAPHVGRHAAACDARPRARGRPAPPRGRRAHDCARRDDPGADPGAPPRASPAA